ncbi:MAG: very short patch repair endonuclease [Phycisphaerae bacterium]
MTDTLTRQQRHRCMSAVRNRDTAPELALKRALRAAGLRYRSQGASLPGTPDVVLRERRAVIMVHGCFWHMHTCRKGTISPRTHAAFWRQKRNRNRVRDRRVRAELVALGWRVITIWECQAHDLDRLTSRLILMTREKGRRVRKAR